jgi:alkylation response protein AidB-like acyl-CoA dehydrogenase
MTAPTHNDTQAPPEPAATPAPVSATPGNTVLPPVRIAGDDLRELTRTLADTSEYYDRSAEFPWSGIDAVHRSGILTATVSAEHGVRGAGGGGPGARGLSGVEAVRTFEALGEGDPAVALISAMTVLQHAAQAANPWWPEELYRRVLEQSSAGPTLINAVRAEPELGAPARGGLPATTVRRTATGWVLNGEKAFATGSEGLAYHLVWAVSDGSPLEGTGPVIGHVIVPADTPGIRVERTWDHLGMRASSTHNVHYTDVEVPFENFRGVPVGTVPNNAAGGGALHLIVPALYVGVARAAQAFFIRFANERVPSSLGRPIASTERIQTVAGSIEAQLVQAEEVLYGLAARIDAGDAEAGSRLGLAKVLASRAAISAVQEAVDALGNPALTRGNPLERHLRDVLCSRPHPPQADAALLAAGRRTLSGAAFRTPYPG